MPEATNRPGLVEEYTETTGAVLGGRDGWDAFPDATAVYGGEWSGPVYVLTHHPEDAKPAGNVTFLTCDVAEAVEIARAPQEARTSRCCPPPSVGSFSNGDCSTRSICTSCRCCSATVSGCTTTPAALPMPLLFVNGDPVEEVNLRYQPIHT